MPVRVLIADNEPDRRLLYRAHIQTIPDFEVVGGARDGNQAVGLCDELRPDLVLMSTESDGAVDESITRLKSEHPEVKVVLIASPASAGGRWPAADAVLARPLGSDTFASALLELSGRGG